MFGLLTVISIIIHICRDEIFVRRQQILNSFRIYLLRHLPSNIVDIDTGTAESTVIDENEIIYENQFRIANLVYTLEDFVNL